MWRGCVMIEKFVKKWEAKKETLRAKYSLAHPSNYKQIVTDVVGLFDDRRKYSDSPNSDAIHEIDDGQYQGTLVYVIPERTYQPDKYWYVRVSYGSCSGCDTLEGIRGYEEGAPSEEQIDQYMTLALHIVQRIKEMDGETA